MTPERLQAYGRDGFLVFKEFLPRHEVGRILADAQEVFRAQCQRFGYPSGPELADVEAGMIRLFKEHPQDFMNCGKQAQHLISLHRLSLDARIVETLKEIGLGFPNISTRPVLYFNHPALAKKDVYWKVDAHQDWRSMQGSLNSMVVWLPLVDIDRSLGALEVVPGSHREGLLTQRVEDGFGMVDRFGDKDFISVELKQGDALFFSSFLVHRSGTNVTPRLRWSCHFRFNDLAENAFIERGYPHPYLYKPQEELITPGYPPPDVVRRLFGDATPKK